MRAWIYRAAVGAILASAAAGAARAEEPEDLPTGKRISPRGSQVEVGSFPCNLVPSPDGKFIAVTDAGTREFVTILDATSGKILGQVGYNNRRRDRPADKQGLYYGLAWGAETAEGRALYVSRGAEDRIGVLQVDAAGKPTDTGRLLDNPSDVKGAKEPRVAAGLALDAGGGRIFCANNNAGPLGGHKSSVSVLDVAQNKVLAAIDCPGFPFAILAIPGGKKLYVTSERDGVVGVIDPAGGAAGALAGRIATGDHPAALAVNKSGSRLFVSNSGSDTVTVLDTATDAAVDTILLRPEDARGLPGATPLGLALAPDERTLYVAMADMNAVAVATLDEKGAGKLAGYIPVGWYPTAVALSPDGRRLFVAAGKGAKSRYPNKDKQGPGGAWGQYILDIMEGTVEMIDIPPTAELAAQTRETLKNNLIRPGMDAKAAAGFANPGIQHVIYVIKENRAYDQVLGDMPQGNGDPSLTLFGRDATPNQHALAERFVLLDNFYVCAEVSADGWNWSTSGMANEYTQRNSRYNYAGRGRRYDFEGQTNGAPVDILGVKDVAEAPCGYLWDHCLRNGVEFRNYGFFNAFITDDVMASPLDDAGKPIVAENAPTKKALAGRTDLDYLLFALDYPDSDAWIKHDCPAPKQRMAYGANKAPCRILEFRREFDEFVKSGKMPPFIMLRLPRDHTEGTTPGFSSAKAMVADNDYAVGELVEMVSKSPYWSSTAIFILEDDAQDGHDHVDAHRSPGFVISPFISKGTVDHRFYNTDSMLRTMELLLGMGPMNMFDAVAPVMGFLGEKAANAEPFEAILPDKAVIAEVNHKDGYRAGECEKLDFQRADAVPDGVLNDILWHSIKGADTPEPAPRHGLRLAEREEAGEDRD